MKKAFLFPLLAFLIIQGVTAQVKLGDNPQSIDPASLFELESTEQVLVITRVTNAELQAITPSMGALAYNTDEKCLFYHNGEVWVNLCEALGRAFTTDAIQNEFPTIVITPLEESINFEVGEIRSENIVDFSIGSQDIQNNSINSEKLADASVGAAELQDNAVTGRNLDFVDITLSDFVNDVPFLVQGNLVAAAIFYDNTASGLGGSDIQAAIDVLSSGLNDIDLRAVGDGTYIFTGSDGTTTTFDLNATALPFDNGSNGFTATTVQGAIEEIQGGSSDDQTLTLNSPLLEIEDGNSVDLSEFLDNTDEQGLTLNGSILAIENGNTVDLSGLTSGVNTDEQQITEFSFEPTTNTLTLEIENATSESLDLSTLDQPAPDGSETRIADSPTVTVTGTGTAADPYQLASAGGADGSETIIQNTATVTVAGAGTAADPYLLTSAGGADGSETIIGDSPTVTVVGTGTTADPYILTSTGGTGGADGSETIVTSTATVTVTGTGTAADPYLLESTGGADGSETVIDDSATVTVSGTGTTADPYVLTSTGGTGGGDGSETIINSTATVTVTGSGTTADPYTLESAGGSDDQIASEVPFSPIGATASNNVQAAIEELQTDIDGLSGNIANPNDELINTFELSGTSLEITEATVLLPPVDLGSIFATDAELLAAIAVSDAADGDTESDNEIQTITSTDGSISITQTGVDYDLIVTGISDDQNIQGSSFDIASETLIIGIEGGTSEEVSLADFALDTELAAAITASEIADGDQDDNNEIQTITSADGSIAVSQTGNDYDLSVPIGSDDQNIQGSSFDIASETITIGIEGGISEDVSLADFALDSDVTAAITASELADGDRDDSNEIELPGGGNTGDVLSTDGGGTYAWIPNTSTDDQNIQGSVFDLASETLTIGIEGGSSEDVSLADFALDTDLTAAITASELADGDRDDSNEIELPVGGNTGDLLSTDGVGTYSWIPNTSTDDQNATEVLISVLAPANYIPTATHVEGHLEGIDAALATMPSLPSANAVQSDPLRTYDLNGGNLAFIGSGRIGIGSSLTNPQSKLDVDGQVQSRGGFASTGGTEGNPGYGFYTNGDTNTGMFRAAADQLAFSTGGVEALRVNASQNVGIGTDSPSERLQVQGNILASGTITPDYVFEKYFKGESKMNPEYEFQNLREIYAFIQKNNHLPGVPSAEAISEQGGVLVNRATEINLEKIEELFLHAIEQEQQIQSLQEEKEILSREVLELKLRLDRIEQAIVERPKN